MKKDSYSYKGWLVSDKFYKRMFAVFGYGVAFYLFLLIVWGLLYLIFGLVIGF